jgi:hypothetical protein
MSIGFLTFAGGDFIWDLALRRIRYQAKNAKVFTNIQIYRPEDLFSLSTSEDQRFILNNKRGYGFWIWKPIIILDYLTNHPEIDSILYADAGCDLNFNLHSLETWKGYVTQLKHHDVIAFKMELFERAWTKQEVFNSHPEFETFRDQEQLLGGVFLMNRDYAIKFCTNWLEIMRSNSYKLLDNSFDPKIQDASFQQPRHDQSIFSLLTKKNPNALILDSLTELYFEPDWRRGISYPIWTSRNKSLVAQYSKRRIGKMLKFGERAYLRLVLRNFK